MIKHKYGYLPEESFRAYKKKLHSLIHWLLVYSDNNVDYLDDYYDKVLNHLSGLAYLFDDPLVTELIVTVASSKVIHNKTDFDRARFRRLILDAHDLIDRLYE